MTKRVLVIGGYGNFGRFICEELAKDSNISLIVAGRSGEQAKNFACSLVAEQHVASSAIDVSRSIKTALEKLKPDLVINTVGPFQDQSYQVAEACIHFGCHYLDLADGRDFVVGIRALEIAAKSQNISVVSGASSVPCLSAAVIDHYSSQFASLHSIEYGISTAQHTTRGLATTQAVLSYAGKSFPTLINGDRKKIFGWHGIRSYRFKTLGKRWLSNCDVPDLTLFPERYKTLKTVRFYAGLEIPLLQFGLWGLSWLVRSRLISNLASWAKFLLKIP